MDDERQDCWQKEKTHEELKKETKGIRYHHFTSWWFQPTGKILVKMGIFPQIGLFFALSAS